MTQSRKCTGRSSPVPASRIQVLPFTMERILVPAACASRATLSSLFLISPNASRSRQTSSSSVSGNPASGSAG